MDRKYFLIEFLGALGAIDIAWRRVSDNYIEGTVQYEPSIGTPHYEPEKDDYQDFCWHGMENDIPSEYACLLAELLNRKRLLHSDKINISVEKLRKSYNKEFSENLEEAKFEEVLREILEFRIPMMDDGEETDYYFIHL